MPWLLFSYCGEISWPRHLIREAFDSRGLLTVSESESATIIMTAGSMVAGRHSPGAIAGCCLIHNHEAESETWAFETSKPIPSVNTSSHKTIAPNTSPKHFCQLGNIQTCEPMGPFLIQTTPGCDPQVREHIRSLFPEAEWLHLIGYILSPSILRNFVVSFFFRAELYSLFYTQNEFPVSIHLLMDS